MIAQVVPPHSALHLEQLFRHCFGARFNTVLEGGASEPLYQPGSAGESHRIVYSHDYFRSALHEIAHWCVAGPTRRQLVDYGYWYAPDGRNPQQQAEFQQLEIYPQALELIFCAACGETFRVSLDNLHSPPESVQPFEQAVLTRARRLMHSGLNERALRWAECLAQHFRGADQLSPSWLDEVFIGQSLNQLC